MPQRHGGILLGGTGGRKPDSETDHRRHQQPSHDIRKQEAERTDRREVARRRIAIGQIHQPDHRQVHLDEERYRCS